MANTIFSPLINFNATITKFQGKFSNTTNNGRYTKAILEALKVVNKKPISNSSRECVTKCYRTIIPVGFKWLKLSPKMAKQMKKDFDLWTAIPHFDKFEIDLVESYCTRDHYLHPLCVFATGMYTLAHLHIHRTEKLTIQEIEGILPDWLFCSLLHDLGYVIEKYSEILDVFFSKFLMVKYSAIFNFKEVMFDGNYHKNMKEFNDTLMKFLRRNSQKKIKEHEIESVVNNILLVENDHGMISALSAYERLDNVIAKFNELISEANLLKHASKKRTPLEKKELIVDLGDKWDNKQEYSIFKNAYFRDDYFAYLKGDRAELSIIEIRKDFEKIRGSFDNIVLTIGLHNKLVIKLDQEEFKLRVSYKDELLVFLLLYCDAVQDWGRSKQQNGEMELESVQYECAQEKLIARYKRPLKPPKEPVLGKISELIRISRYLNADNFIEIVVPGYPTVRI